MVKGALPGGSIAILIIIVCATIIGASFSLNIPWITGRNHQVIYYQTFYTMDNALDGAELYMEHAAKYSLYQACHEMLANPPQFESLFFWELQNNMKDNLNKYTSQDFVFLDSYRVDLPEYNVEFVTDPQPLVMVTSEIPISVDEKNTELNVTTHLERDPNQELDFICYNIYLKYVNVRNDLSDGIKNIIETNTNTWPQEDTHASVVTTDCNEVFQAAAGMTIEDAQTQIAETIKQESENILPASDSTYEITSSIDGVNVLIISNFKFSDAQTGTTCDFSYEAKVSLKSEIKDTQKSYPVGIAGKVETVNYRAILAGDVTESGFITTYTGPGTKFDEYIKKASDTFGIDQALIKAVIKTESNFDPNAKSSAGAKGLMQLTSIGIEDVTVEGNPSHDFCKQKGFDFTSDYISHDDDSVFDPEKNIMTGSCMLAYLLDKFEGDLALIAYNAGPGRIDGWQQCIGDEDATWDEIKINDRVEITE
ncbi:MAG: lytic transglycosylase domain-containing protein, partial [Nanoarchaeota archaeon]|nr:lytic transglycosylase domain-containing protein [Nanoarchaeota archaeon]